jgi:tetratricopeptide (TPR) repeat protein
MALERSADLFERANAEYDAASYELALELFEKVLSTGLVNEVVYNNKGTTLDALGRGDEARECYEEALSLNPSYELAWHNLGNSLFLHEMYERSAKAYAKAAKLNDTRRENFSGLAAAYARAGMNERAKAAVERLKPFAESDDSVLLLQADLFLEAGFLERARERCLEYISKHPDDVNGHARLGTISHELGEYNAAIFAFSRATKLDPKDKELWNNMGYSCFCRGYLDRALECFDKALLIDPKYKQAWYNKGYAYHGADRLEEAVECYEKALSIDSHDRVLWNNLGNALYNLGKYANSIPKFVEAIRVDPDYEIAWNNIGNALEKMNMFADAIPYHDRSLEIDPVFDYALYAKGVCRSKTGDLEGGYDLVLESIDLNPEYDEAWKARAHIATLMGRWDEALMCAEQSLAVNPEFDEGWTLRGEILGATGDLRGAEVSFSNALECLEEVSPLTTIGLMAIIRRGDILARLGRFDEALANYETVALAKKLEFVSVPRVLRMRKLLGKWDLSDDLREAIAAATDISAMISYADFLVEAGDLKGAGKITTRIASYPNGSELLIVKARERALAGDTEGAIRLLSSQGIESRDSAAAKLEGELREAKGDLANAALSYEREISKSPGDVALMTALSRVQQKMGQHRLAIQTADAAIGIDDREWEPHKVKADAFAALGEMERHRSELAQVSARLALAGLRLEDVGVRVAP